MKNYGLKLKPIEADNYIFGASPLSGMSDIKPDGDWRVNLPKFEKQILPNGEEPYDCTVAGGENQIEILMNFLFNIEHNFDEQFNYNLCEIDPPGADPQLFYESVRKQGLTEGAFKQAQTLADFKKPRPMTDEYLKEGKKYVEQYDFKHEWLFTNNPTKSTRLNLLRTGLKKSPVAISVSAWASDDNELYVSNFPNNHWVVCVAVEGDSPIVFDTYEKSLKKLHPDHEIQVAKLIYIEKKVNGLTQDQRDGFLAQLKALLIWLGILQKQVDALKVDNSIPTPKDNTYNEVKETLMKRDLLTEFCNAIAQYEGGPGDLNHKNNNPGNLRSVKGPFLKFKTWDEGMLALRDYVTRACTGKHKAYKPDFTITEFFNVYAPSSDNNNPYKYASWVAGKLGVLTTMKIKDLLT